MNPVLISLVLTNLGLIGSLVVVGFKITWWVSKLEAKVETTKDLGIRAHKRIDKIEEKI